MNFALWYGLFHIGSIVTVVLTLLLSTKILRSSRMPAVTIGWLLAIILIPLVGIPLYLTFGERKLNINLNNKQRLILDTSKKSNQHIVSHPIHSLVVSLNLPASCTENESTFDENGKAAWQSLTRLLENAQISIDIAIFILGNDTIGNHILSILERKAAEGVKIRLLLDGVGTFSITKKRFKPLLKLGAQIAWFIPVIHNPLRGRTNLRNHRKIVITDNKQVWAGGRNISGDYLGPNCPSNCWVDISFVQTGAIVAHYLEIFEADWAFSIDNKVTPSVELVGSKCAAKNKSELQLIPSGPDVEDDPIYSVVLTAYYAAKSHIMIVTPYYIPDDNIQKALKLAALRGVTVDLITPLRSNHKIADIARNRSIRELAAAGVNIWFLPQMIHAKVMIIDQNFAMAGSANLDIRSLFLNCELMSAFYSKQDVTWLSEWFISLQNNCSKYQNQKVTALREIVEGFALLASSQL